MSAEAPAKAEDRSYRTFRNSGLVKGRQEQVFQPPLPARGIVRPQEVATAVARLIDLPFAG